MARICKKTVFAILAFVLSYWVVMAGIFPAVLPVFAQASAVVQYERTNVVDDLKESVIDGKKFVFEDYDFDSLGETQVLSLVEYCYSFYGNLQDNYGLYIYLYNPKGIKFDVNDTLNTVQLAFGESLTASYHKYPLRFLNYSTAENSEGLFYKFKVGFSSSQKKLLLKTLDVEKRVYRISGIELVQKGESNAKEFFVGRTYYYSGYAAGYGSDEYASSTLICNMRESEVLTLNVYPTQYRPDGTNGKNDYTQDSLHSVYFAVPNEIIKKYGSMSAVHATWLDAVLKPALVTGNKTAYDTITPLLGKNIKEVSAFEYMYLGAYGYQKNGEAGSLYLGGYTYYNPEPLMRNDAVLNHYYGKDIETLYSLYYAGDGTDSADNYSVSSNIILSDLKASKMKYGGELVNGKYSVHMFESVAEEWTDVNIKADETFSLTDEIIDKSWWDKFWGLKGDITTNTFDGIKAIYEVKESDLFGDKTQVAKKLYIGEADCEAFIEFYHKNKASATLYLLRYQVSDYIAQEATLLKKNTSIFGDSFKDVDSNAYFFQQTVNLDFDIIDVTFSSGEKDMVVPVVANPIDVVPGANPPVNTKSDKSLDLLKYLKTTVVTLFVLVILVLFLPLTPLLVGLLRVGLSLIVLPFRWIGKVATKGKRKEDKEK